MWFVNRKSGGGAANNKCKTRFDWVGPIPSTRSSRRRNKINLKVRRASIIVNSNGIASPWKKRASTAPPLTLPAYSSSLIFQRRLFPPTGSLGSQSHRARPSYSPVTAPNSWISFFEIIYFGRYRKSRDLFLGSIRRVFFHRARWLIRRFNSFFSLFVVYSEF